ncbi:MAG: NAD(P)/FAD-dependent oxidoreductase [Luteitalea sp.]|nr:NAD(P)/FAD-dependent oxidoreductase [Luteitalea sp.]
MSQLACDVAVVGASVSGCAAATLFARAGLRVALLEQSADPHHFKRVCTHFIQPSAAPAIDRLGIGEAMLRAGGKRNVLEIWTKWGWIRGSARSKGYNLRRQKLDPLMRQLAASTPGVEFLPGRTARSLTAAGGRITGVEAEGRCGRLKVSARLVVGADGRDSRIGALSGLKATDRPNNRFTYFTYYRGLSLGPTANSRYWYLDSSLTYAFENDDETTLLGVFLPQRELPAFKTDLEGSFARLWASLEGAPDLGGAERVSEMRGMLRMPNRRRPAAGRGVAVVGDAALALDPIWGTGCGFAMQSAEWLVDQTAETLADRRSPAAALDAALSRYRRLHRRRTGGHALHISDFSRVRKTRCFERLLFSAAARDRSFADVVLAYLGREDGLLDVAAPRTLLRAVWVNAGHMLENHESPA